MIPPPAAAKGSNKTIIIVLIILGVILLLFGACAVSCFVIGKKAQSALTKYEKHPEMAGIAMAAKMHPDLQVVSEDADAGIITIRSKETGEVVKFDMAKIRSGEYEQVLEQLVAGKKVKQPAPAPVEPPTAEPAEPASEPETPAPAVTKPVEPKVTAAKANAMDASLKKFPAYAPAYPGAKTLQAKTTTLAFGTVGEYEATTTDTPQKVIEYYAERFRAAGVQVIGQSEDANDFGPTAELSGVTGESGGTVAVKAESEEGGKVRVRVDYTLLPKS